MIRHINCLCCERFISSSHLFLTNQRVEMSRLILVAPSEDRYRLLGRLIYHKAIAYVFHQWHGNNVSELNSLGYSL